MSTHQPMIAVDVVGGDFAPAEIIAGIELSLRETKGVGIIAVGPVDIVEPLAAAHERIVAVVATEAIDMHDHPASAVRAKKDSSIVVAARLVKEGRADAFFSAGSTGAVMAAATLVVGRLPGVHRPAIATVLPTVGLPCVLLDAGANADCKAENLLQFAHMGSAYATTVLSVDAPRVALLNIGEEPTKGSVLTQEAFALLSEGCPGFIGNVEGRDVLEGVADVIVTDGFTGNVALKLLEGTSSVLLRQVKEAMTSSVITTLAAATMKPALLRLKARLDPDTYGGAPLLGVNGVCIIGHGASSAKAVANAIRVGDTAVRGGLTSRIANALVR
ncbi:MAG: phosphate acyltransferase PlsX [Coriobacteriia bacterium]|nr:phosphate acyltransferase PlsX [Coriobacteriia bacterium]